MPAVTFDHFLRAAADIGANGDNDMLPFDIDVRFVNDRKDDVARVATDFYVRLDQLPKEDLRGKIRSLDVFAERLLVPAGASGFRISTKIHPFWNVYLNGLGVAIEEAHEPQRLQHAHSYRYTVQGDKLFDTGHSWRAFREACLESVAQQGDEAVIVQTDITSFYEHIYQHRLASLVDDLFPGEPNLSLQVERFLSKLASGRSFGLPVGGQFARILAELLLSEVDKALTDEGISWKRYVDDFVLIADSQEKAYIALAKLSHMLADYGLTLNRTKTTFMTGRHFTDYVTAQLGIGNDEATKLREIDIHFDPYSDAPVDDYSELRDTVESLEVQTLLDLELNKAQPDTFLVAQIGRTLKLHSPAVALQLCKTLLSPRNLHAFRASWATIMRGISAVRADDSFREIFGGIDTLLDGIPESSPHLLSADSSCLHYLRSLRFTKTEARGQFVRSLYRRSQSQTVRRACIDCWRQWRDRQNFIAVRNQWNALDIGQQRMLWLAASEFGDDGENFRMQERRAALSAWALGLETENDQLDYARLYQAWCA